LTLLALLGCSSLSLAAETPAERAAAAAKWVNERGFALPRRGDDPLSVDTVEIRAGTKLAADDLSRLAAFAELRTVTLNPIHNRNWSFVRTGDRVKQYGLFHRGITDDSAGRGEMGSDGG